MPFLQTGNVVDDTAKMVSAMRDTLKADKEGNPTARRYTERGRTLKVMIVGDSMSQGRESD
jgi:hypothetical protein